MYYLCMYVCLYFIDKYINISCNALIISNVFVLVRRVPPQFSIPPPEQHEVTLGSDLNLTCVAIGSPMPYVKWRRGPAQDLTPEDKLPIGRNVLELTGIQESANYTCVAASALGVIEATTHVKVQCKCLFNILLIFELFYLIYFNFF